MQIVCAWGRGDAGNLRASLAVHLPDADVHVWPDVPLTAATRDSIDASFLAQLPAGAHVVNTARGEIIVDAALLAALDAGHIASATLDVFREEPLPAAHPFWHHPRISITPHVAAATLMEPAVAQIAERIATLERGIAVDGAVDIARGY